MCIGVGDGGRGLGRVVAQAGQNQIEMFTILKSNGEETGLSYKCPHCLVAKDLHHKRSGMTDAEARGRCIANSNP